ncbi:MAG: hypothetical protein LBH75_03395 [Treponema sp.]|nr:hypothetical protein [Treponema sp.]
MFKHGIKQDFDVLAGPFQVSTVFNIMEFNKVYNGIQSKALHIKNSF